MGYPDAAWERAMTVQEVMLKAVSGEIHWFRAADILGWSPRTLRRWRVRYEEHGYAGLVDRRWVRPSKRRIPAGEVERVLRLYRERYSGFNVRHFQKALSSVPYGPCPSMHCAGNRQPKDPFPILISITLSRARLTGVEMVSSVVTVQALWNVGTDFVLVPFAVISYALGDEAGAHEAIAA